MSARTATRLAWGLWGLLLACLAGGVLVDLVNGRTDGDHVPLIVLFFVISIPYGTVGALVSARQPGNAVGWILLGGAFLFAAFFLLQEYAVRGLVTAPGSLPGATLAAWGQNWILAAALAAVPFVFLLFPTGGLPSRRWRPLAWLVGAAAAGVIVGGLINPAGYGETVSGVDLPGANPTGVRSLESDNWWFVMVAFILLTAAAGAAPAVRLRRATGRERLQLLWVGRMAAVVVVTAGISVPTGILGLWIIAGLLYPVMLLTLIFGFPIALAVSILKYRLFDIEVVIRRAVVFGILATFLTAVYVAIVVGIGTAVGSTGESNVALPALAAAIVAVAVQPVRVRAQRLANRLVYGRRATPYEVLSEFSDRLAGAYSTDDVLPRMAQIVANGTRAVRAEVWLRVGSTLRPAAVWPPEGVGTPGPLVVAGDELPDIPGVDRALAVRHQGELLGSLAVAMPPSEPLTASQEQLVQDLAAQAGLVLRNVRLIEELRASRQRLVAAQDAERRRLERNIHDGAQQQLVALAVKQRTARNTAGRDPAKADELFAQVEADIGDALETLRELARGIYPPVLADRGLTAALDAHARRAPLPVEVEADGMGRYPQEAEAAVYFCCLEALQNVAKYAEASRVVVSLSGRDGELVFRVVDDGVGFDPATTPRGSGLQNMADRIAALDGTLEIRSEPGRGTTVAGRIPAGPHQPAKGATASSGTLPSATSARA